MGKTQILNSTQARQGGNLIRKISVMLMRKLEELRKHLTDGEVYRRADLAQWSKSADRHVAELVGEGALKKLAGGLYDAPKASAFG